MKECKPFMINIAIGISLFLIGLGIPVDYYRSMACAGGFGMVFSSCVHLIRILYWQNPKRRSVYEARKEEVRINNKDERAQYIRMKSGQIAYQVMTLVLLLLAFVLALLRVDVWIISMVFLLFLLNWIVGAAAFHMIQKKV